MSKVADSFASYFSQEARQRVGFKVTVKNFSKELGESEFYSMFVRKGEVRDEFIPYQFV
jgi:hypothetical protein